jgi:hypothetical protein
MMLVIGGIQRIVFQYINLRKIMIMMIKKALLNFAIFNCTSFENQHIPK